MGVFKTITSGYATVCQAKDMLDAACEPVQWFQDQMVSAVRAALLEALTRSAGGPAARAMVERLDVEGKTYPLELHIPVHAKLRGVIAKRSQNVQWLQDTINQALAAPLHTWGYRLVEVALDCPQHNSEHDGNGELVLRAHLGLQRMGTPGIALETTR